MLDYTKLSSALRVLAAEMVENANSGHPGMPLGFADVATVLYAKFLRFDATNPTWANRDRFVLSVGHGSALLYALLFLTGYKDVSMEDLKKFRQLHSKAAGHPEYGYFQAIETTTGPLGQGLANAVGMAIAAKLMQARFGEGLFNHKIYVAVGDGCLMEGISHEALCLAAHLKLDNLIVLFDDNGISIDGNIGLTSSEDVVQRVKSYGFNVITADGHDYSQIENALSIASANPISYPGEEVGSKFGDEMGDEVSDKVSDKSGGEEVGRGKPFFIAFKTTIGYGADAKAGSEKSHGSPLGGAELQHLKKGLNWQSQPFDVPTEILKQWRVCGKKSQEIAKDWQENISSLEPSKKQQLEAILKGELTNNLADIIKNIKKEMALKAQNADMADVKEATRKSSGYILECLSQKMPSLIGGSADLSGSNNTSNQYSKPITKIITPSDSKLGSASDVIIDFSGNYIHYGIREHAMAAIMNGVALSGNFIPYGGTFLVFSDYARPAIRLSSLMRKRVIYIMTHDSIGLGEDGPTHQPIEHLASLRAIPNLNVMRPADFIETAESLEIAMEDASNPSLIALSRQSLPLIRKEYREGNLCKKGAYIIADYQGNLSYSHNKVVIYATGSEVHLAIKARQELAKQSVAVRVVSVPSCFKFWQTSQEYQREILCKNKGNESVYKFAIEAGIKQGWSDFIGDDGEFIGMDSFGESGKAEDLFHHFGITAENLVAKIKAKIS